MSEGKYEQGGVIGEPVPFKLEVGERVINPDGTVYELQTVEGRHQWVKIGVGYEMWMGK